MNVENSTLIDLTLDIETENISNAEVKNEVISEFEEKLVEDIPSSNSQHSNVYENVETESLKID